MTQETYFGYEKVSESEKTQRVKDLFTNVSSKYDLMNDLMSLGAHRLWKKDLITRLPIKKNDMIIDVAGGTGDISIGIQKRFRYLTPKMVVCDLTERMMVEGRKKAHDEGMIADIQWIAGNAEMLPLDPETFNGYVISFGLRNVANHEKAIQEAFRILKPGSFFYCLEFSHIQNCPTWEQVYNRYSNFFIPKMGEWVALNRSAYDYLVDSIRTFPAQHTVQEMLENFGFTKVHYKNYLGGIACLHYACR